MCKYSPHWAQWVLPAGPPKLAATLHHCQSSNSSYGPWSAQHSGVALYRQKHIVILLLHTTIAMQHTVTVKFYASCVISFAYPESLHSPVQPPNLFCPTVVL